MNALVLQNLTITLLVCSIVLLVAATMATFDGKLVTAPVLTFFAAFALSILAVIHLFDGQSGVLTMTVFSAAFVVWGLFSRMMAAVGDKDQDWVVPAW
jgi:hypothetical protein